MIGVSPPHRMKLLPAKYRRDGLLAVSTGSAAARARVVLALNRGDVVLEATDPAREIR